MNRETRKKASSLCDTASEALTDLVDLLSYAMDELQETYDSRSERWQESEKGEAMQEEIDSLDGLRDTAQQILDGFADLDFGELD
jgi:hypothetical protein